MQTMILSLVMVWQWDSGLLLVKIPVQDSTYISSNSPLVQLIVVVIVDADVLFVLF